MAAPPNPLSVELQAALTSEDMSPERLAEVGPYLVTRCDIRTVSEFVQYFGADRQWIIEFWLSKAEWRSKGSVLAHLRGALQTLQEADSKARQARDTTLDLTLDNPIAADTNKELTDTWKRLYGYRLHPTQEATAQITGGMWRRLQTRQIVAEDVRGLRTLEHASGIVSGKRTWKVGDLRLVEDES